MLHPEARAWVDRVLSNGWVPRHTLTPELAREQLRNTRIAPLARPLYDVRNHTIDGPGGPLKVRVYRPSDAEALPITMFFHGGGWVLGDLELSDAFCREVAAGVDCLVVSVDYRLAPEHRFPCAVDDCLEAISWVNDHAANLGADTSAFALSGISAGGNLAAVCALQLRDQQRIAPLAQVLICPVLDHNFERASYLENATGMLLERDDMRWFWDHYLPTAAWGLHPNASPMQAPDLTGLAPAIVITAEHDPLRDEGAAYAARLRAAGVPVRYRCYHGMIHGFVGNAALTCGREALAELIVDMRLAFRRHDFVVDTG